MVDEIKRCASALGEHLVLQEKRLVLAESCTGGGIAKACTDIAGSSTWFDRGFVTYSNQAKKDMVFVDQQTLDQFGAVSAEVVEAMAEGALRACLADIALSVSGIAGPSGASDAKPLGTVWFAVALRGRTVQSCLKYFEGDRGAVRSQAVSFSLQWLLMLAQKYF